MEMTDLPDEVIPTKSNSYNPLVLLTEDDEHENDGDLTSAEKIGGTPRRWVVLVSFSCLSCLNALMWITFAPVRAGAMAYYDVSGDAIDWLSMIFMVMYPFLFAPASWYIESGSEALPRGLCASAVMNVVGALIRYISAIHGNFTILFIGQIIASAAQSFTLGAPPQISGLWFEEKEWGLATGIGVLANQVGPCIAYMVVPEIVGDKTGDGMRLMLFVELVAASVTGLMIWCLVPKKPSRPPSLIASNRKSEAVTTSFGEYCNKLVEIQKSWYVLFLCAGYGLCVGTLYAFETLLGELIPDQSIDQESDIGTIMLFLATPGAVMGGVLMDITGMYKGITLWLSLGSSICVAIIAVMCTRKQTGSDYGLLVLVCSTFGFLLGALLTAGFEWGVELTFGPGISESTIAGVLNAYAQLCGVAMIYGLEYALDDLSAFYCNVILASILIIASVFYACNNGELKRQNFQNGT